MKKLILTKNPYVLFAPMLALYFTLVLYLPTNGKFGDETYYLMYVQNLLNGFYSPPSPNVDLMYGPGYPIILLPFIAAGLPLISITLFNAVLYYFSIILLFKSLQQIVSYRMTLVISIFWAFYYHSFEQLHLIYTETITAFLITLIIYCFVKSFNQNSTQRNKNYVIIAGIGLGYIALIKLLFGYVLICLLIGSGLLLIIRKKNTNYRKGFLIITIALLTTSPYLLYTYHLTGRVLYWGSSGGNNLYWMSSPHHREYGDWYNFNKFEINSNKFEPSNMPGKLDSIRANHWNDYKKLLQYSGIEKDDMFKTLAIRNIESDPLKFLQNCISNFGRLLFNFPSSYTLQRPINLLRLPLNGTLLIFLILTSFLAVSNLHKIHYYILFILFIALLYIGGSILGSAEPRMFSVIVPILLIWIAYILDKTVQITWRNE